jgi:hypothetical protein
MRRIQGGRPLFRHQIVDVKSISGAHGPEMPMICRFNPGLRACEVGRVINGESEEFPVTRRSFRLA